MAKDLVEYIVKSLVDEPDEVDINEMRTNSSLVLEISVAGDDMGRVIGRRGRVINAVRELVEVQAARTGKHVTVEVV